MKIGNTYSHPKETKSCSLCGIEIDKKWKDELCENCRTKLEMFPKLKKIAKLFKIHNHQKDDGGCQMAKETKNKTNKTEEVEDKRLFPVFYTSELQYFDLKIDAKPIEVTTKIREKFGIPIKVRASKKQALIKKLGLDKDATQSDINKAVMELELE